jgi:glycosyltransferase involved in cell wall biosynthesis
MFYIIIPAYNEEKNIGRVIGGLFENGYNHVVVVDDGSTDGTVREAERAGAVVLRHIINRGQGAALQTGDEYALAHEAEAVVHFDADGQFDAADITPALAAMREARAEMVMGSRFMDRRSRMPLSKKYFLLPIARAVNFLFAGIWLSDAHNGFRILSGNALEKIKITQDGMAHNSDVVRQVKKHGLKFIEHPVLVVYREYGQGLGGGIKILWDLLFAKLT